MKNYQSTTKNYQIGSKARGRKETTNLLPKTTKLVVKHVPERNYQSTTKNYQIGSKAHAGKKLPIYYQKLPNW